MAGPEVDLPWGVYWLEAQPEFGTSYYNAFRVRSTARANVLGMFDRLIERLEAQEQQAG